LYEITEEQVLDNVKLNKDFNYTFGRFLDNYDNHENYAPQMGLARDAVTKFIETFAFNGGNSNVSLTDEAFNLLMFVMLKNRILLAETAFQMSQYAKKSSVDDRAILHAIKCHYSGTLFQTVYKKTEEVSRVIRRINKEAEEEEKANSKKGSKDSSDKLKKKQVKLKKIQKKNQIMKSLIKKNQIKRSLIKKNLIKKTMNLIANN